MKQPSAFVCLVAGIAVLVFLCSISYILLALYYYNALGTAGIVVGIGIVAYGIGRLVLKYAGNLE